VGSAIGDDALAAAARHDPDAFAELYRRHLTHVYRYLLARASDPHLAEDLTAQTFLAALEGIRSYRGDGQFAAWLLRIARNKVSDYYRDRRTTMPLEDAAQIAAIDPLPEQVIASRLHIEHVARALQALAPERAEALTLRLFGGLSVAEIGRSMGKSEAAVKMLVHRGLRNLQQRLGSRNEAEV
jgi:RNA polymerase sigma-70 factor (ECF subfamily)